MRDYNERLAALRQKMREAGTDLVAVGPGSHMEWLVGIRLLADERPCLLLVTQRAESLLVPALNAEEVRKKSAIAVFPWSDDKGADAALSAALSVIGAEQVTSVALDETMRTDFALLLLNCLPTGVKTSFASATVGFLRMLKDAGEIAALKESAAVADRAVIAAFEAIRPGIREKDLAAVVRAEFDRQGATPAFWMVGSGVNGSFPHHTTSDRRLQAGDAIVIDIGARMGGFPSDITRMAFLGRPSAKYLEVHAIVERAVQAALAAARPGVPAKAVDEAARKVITDAGYGDYFVHRTGHGLGIDIHEPPFITGSNEMRLQEGNVFSIEPGIYLPGEFGVRLEEIVVLRATGPEIFSNLTRNLRIVAA